MGEVGEVLRKQVVIGGKGTTQGAAMSDVKLSQKSMTALFRGTFEPRVKQEGEAPALTFSHLKDGQVYKTDWATPVRPGAMDHLGVQSKGDSV